MFRQLLKLSGITASGPSIIPLHQEATAALMRVTGAEYTVVTILNGDGVTARLIYGKIREEESCSTVPPEIHGTMKPRGRLLRILPIKNIENE